MTRYLARMLDSVSGGEGAYEFDHREDLMSRPGDEIVAAFFEHADREIFTHDHVDYELNGVIKKPELKTVVAIGQLHRRDHEDHGGAPFTLFISAVR